jgi:FtsP/CotA-like multicopper oxidase with cupredoxin domain
VANSRREFLRSILASSGGLLAAGTTLASQQRHTTEQISSVEQACLAPAKRDVAATLESVAQITPSGIALPVETPDLSNLPFTVENGVKVFNLIAEPVKRRVAPYKMMQVWGYNGSCPGPTIQVNQGDRVRIIFDNHLPESTTIHWHGLEVPMEMDGLPYISQQPVPPGGRSIYEFTLHQEGTYFYHSHGAMQEMIGMIGLFILHPQKPYKPKVDHDYGIVLQEWAILPDNNVPNTANMEFNWLTVNGVSAPATTPLLARLGSRVRIRIVNLGMDHHPIHLHGNQFVVTGTEAGRAPEPTWRPENTVLVGVAQARDIEFDAKYPGEWMLHCHLPHHMMNTMSDLLAERMITTSATNEAQSMTQMETSAESNGVEHVHHAPISPNANSVPGFPQDAFMEMGMDAAVEKPETHGLPPNWSAGLMGMMSLVRVLPPEKYDEIMALKQRGSKRNPADRQGL